MIQNGWAVVMVGALAVMWTGLLAWAVFRIRAMEKRIWRNLEGLLDQEWDRRGDALQRLGSDLSERIARATAEFRGVLAERLNAEMREIHRSLEESLALNRKELREGLSEGVRSLESRFQAVQEDTRSGLERVREVLDSRLLSLGREVQSRLDANLREGFKHFERVQEHLRAAEDQLRRVGEVGASINELHALLRLPHLRGEFGEITLERLLADFLPAHLYEIQATIQGVGKVDALVRFPASALPIDSKFPRERVLPLFQETSPESLRRARRTLHQVLRAEAQRIERYIRPEAGTMDMALMFLPSETLYFEAIRNVALWTELARRKVFPVSPNTLAVTLRAVAVAQQYYEMARNVESTLVEVRKAQRHFGLFLERFEDVGKELERARSAYRTASTHLGRYAGSIGRLTTAGEIRPEGRLKEEAPK